ncbi:cupin domain-containing protein [Rubellimicrobium sp. CFH 75288]|uniref:cupin domain-containing protein n=1 Tax=Rubellimicrobium sp. CFH 75288 TaxID=2697034 RepID=UPI0014129414|nr:cupin domain-containing protein [Rubellimicrobium sp. CFH 75288]NAZ35721.1 helix-turn-helix domain-containing protein [Rubellimicrobium sp. CFH 75288]
MTRPEGGHLVGQRLRARRRALGLTLEEVAERIGLTKGFLSEIERDRTSPSVASLVRLCEVLDLPVGSLFAGPAAGVVRAAERAPIAFGGHRIRDVQITPAGTRWLLAIHSTLEPGGGGGETQYSLRSEEEMVLVLSGRLCVTVEAETYELGPGDALTFDPRRAHTFVNPSRTDPAEALFVLVPPP